ncbi:mitochondrial proton/calcium exchanger protein-like isoform X1 [Macrobrachium nipponense]|uniref:mitochondrial proton/calcium exchanger protein-like isoform X1 n=1 Tax=Macrobrachium nipponense TaxID=159736 RepID=UPI0030C872D0
MSVVSGISGVFAGATRNARNGGILHISRNGVVMLRQSWKRGGIHRELASAYSVVPGGGWVTQGPGQHQVQCQVLPSTLISPALRVSYTTVYVPGIRSFHASTIFCDKESLKPSSQVEVTVKDLKEKAKAAGSPIAQEKKTDLAERKSLAVRIKDEILHYYHGFRLLFIDVKICTKYVWRIVNGESLSRREHRQLVRTTADLFRLLPFSVFIIVPFMEFLLPVALKLFPGMLPSTFETANEKEAKMKKMLKSKLEMAKFLQQTLDNMAVQAKGHSSESAKEFVQFFEKVQKTGEEVSNEEILKFSKLFEDEITLDSLSRPQLVALCQLLEMQPFGTNNFLRFQLRMKLRTLAADDKIIQVEGIDSMAVWELQQACRARGMRAYGLSKERLQSQLNQWLDLSLNEKVPPSLLLLSRTLYLPENVRPSDTLAATISTLSEEVATRTKAAIGKREGKIDNLTRLEIIKAEERKIAEDKKELERVLEDKRKQEQLVKKKAEVESLRQEEAMQKATEEIQADIIGSGVDLSQVPTPSANKILTEGVQVTKATVSATGEIKKIDKEELVDEAPVVKDKAEVLSEELPKKTQETIGLKSPTELTKEDLKDVEGALETLGVEKKKLMIEENELSELKTELADYKEDIEDFKAALIDAGIDKKELRESKAAKRLFIRVNKMLNRMEPLLEGLSKEKAHRQMIVDAGKAKALEKAEIVSLEELAKHMTYICHTPDTSKVEMIRDVLVKMDFDHDGGVKVDHVLKVLELMLDEHTGVPPKLVEDIIEMMAKEEQLETATLIQHALKRTMEENVKMKSQDREPSHETITTPPQQMYDKVKESHETKIESELANATREQHEGIGIGPDTSDTEDKKQAKRSQ